MLKQAYSKPDNTFDYNTPDNMYVNDCIAQACQNQRDDIVKLLNERRKILQNYGIFSEVLDGAIRDIEKL